MTQEPPAIHYTATIALAVVDLPGLLAYTAALPDYGDVIPALADVTTNDVEMILQHALCPTFEQAGAMGIEPADVCVTDSNAPPFVVQTAAPTYAPFVAPPRSKASPAIVEGAERMAALSRQLLETVAAMHATYSATDDALNEFQPRDFSSVLAASLDEWEGGLHGMADQWEAVAQDLREDVEADRLQAEDEAETMLAALGFRREIGGGGSVHLSHYVKMPDPDGTRGYVWITGGEGGSSMPTATDFLACYYAPGSDGEQAVAIESDSGVTLYQAAQALNAMVAAEIA